MHFVLIGRRVDRRSAGDIRRGTSVVGRQSLLYYLRDRWEVRRE